MFDFTDFLILLPFILLYGFQIFLFIKRLRKKPSHIATQIIVLIINIFVFSGIFVISLILGALSMGGGTELEALFGIIVINLIPLIMLISSIVDLCIRKKFKN